MNAKHKVTTLRRIKAKLDAMKSAGTVCCAEFRNGDYFVTLVPTWINGRMYYRKIEWTSFHERAGLGIMSNTYYSAELGLSSIFASARAGMQKAGAA